MNRYQLTDLSNVLSKEQIKYFQSLLKKYRLYDKVDIIIDLSKNYISENKNDLKNILYLDVK